MSNNISYTQIVSIILNEINKLRSDPKSFIPILLQRLDKYDQEGNYYPLNGLNFSVKTKQGKRGVKQLIQYLENVIQLHPLIWSFELHQAADKRCRNLGSGDQNQSNKIANMQIGALVNQFAISKGHLVELTFFGFIEPRQLITQLLLQDGRDIKQNRKQLFNNMANLIGIGINTHEKYRFVVIFIMGMHIARKSFPGESKNSDFTGSSNQENAFCGSECLIF